MTLHQTYAKNYLANLYRPDTSIDILPEYMVGESGPEVIENFLHYRSAIQEMFERISEMDAPDFFTMPPETEKNHHLRVRDAVVIPMRCVFAVLYVVGRYGVLEGDCMAVNKKGFNGHFKKIKKAYVQSAVQMLADNGFHFDYGADNKGSDFRVNYPDNLAVLRGLVSFANTIESMHFNATCYDYGKDARSFTLLNPRLYCWQAGEAKPYELFDVLRFIHRPEDKVAVEQFHNRMVAQGFDFQYDVATFGGRNANIRYQLGKYDPYALVVAKNDGRAYIGLKMRTLGKHSDYIQQCSSAFKAGFDAAWHDCARDV
jgi:hypothetical protein